MLALDGVRFTIGNRERRLRFTWAALLALYELWGEGFEERVAKAIIGTNVGDLTHIVALTLHPEDAMTPDEVIAASPDIKPLCMQLETAWAWAYNGFAAARRYQEVVAKEEAEQAKTAKAAQAKKSFLSRFIFAFGTLTRTRSEAA